MTETYNGCYFFEAWASPKNWKETTAKSVLKKIWYVECRFFDPKFEDLYPRGFSFRRKLNKGNDTLLKRKAATEFMLEEMTAMLTEGYNPITKTFMTPPPDPDSGPQVYNRDTPLFTALDLALSTIGYEGAHLKTVESVLRKFKHAAQELHYEGLPIGDFIGIHLKQIFDRRQATDGTFTDKAYNKHALYLSPLFTLLKSNGLLNSNPMDGFKKKKTLQEKRTVMTLEERRKVDRYLKMNFVSFWIFTNLFHHSGARVIELLNCRYEDVDLDTLTLTVVVKKGGTIKRVELPIKQIAVIYWEKALMGAKKGDYLFSEGLTPGDRVIRREQITRRWQMHVKDKFNIKADFYSIKHGNLTEIVERTDSKSAAKAAGHTTDAMVRKHYDVGHTNREMNNVRNMTNEFAPSVNKKQFKTLEVQIPVGREAEFAAAMARLVQEYATK
jgi:integrase